MSTTDTSDNQATGKVRILALMGSGETAPNLVKTHREIISKFRHKPKLSLLATPYRFQENVFELSEKIVGFFQTSLQTQIIPTDVPTTDYSMEEDFSPRQLIDDLSYNKLLKQADIVFAGPGSPSYALSRWRNSLTKDLLSEKLLYGGAVVFSSAAALTLGAYTLPVYEIYKVGESPTWLRGLNVLGSIGINCAVIPHYNNAEGGTHDTRFCYMGERRLAFLEKRLPEDIFIIGIDEHTCLLINLEESTARVNGIGSVTIRYRGLSHILESNATLGLDVLFQIVDDLQKKAPHAALSGVVYLENREINQSPVVDEDLTTERLAEFRKSFYDSEQKFHSAITQRDATEAIGSLAELLNLLIGHFLPDANQQTTDHIKQELDKSKSRYITLLYELSVHLGEGLRDKAEICAPLIENILMLRNEARKANKYQDADDLRNILLRSGVKLEDRPDGTTGWTFIDEDPDGILS